MKMNESLNADFTNNKEFSSYNRAIYGKHEKN